MKRINIPRDPAAHNSRLIRRPIQRMVWLFLLPTFAAFCIGFIYPFLKGAFLSFCKFKLTSKWTWVGFDNYLKAFADSSFARRDTGPGVIDGDFHEIDPTNLPPRGPSGWTRH